MNYTEISISPTSDPCEIYNLVKPHVKDAEEATRIIEGISVVQQQDSTLLPIAFRRGRQ